MQGQGQGPSLQVPGQGQGLDLQELGQGFKLGQGLTSLTGSNLGRGYFAPRSTQVFHPSK